VQQLMAVGMAKFFGFSFDGFKRSYGRLRGPSDGAGVKVDAIKMGKKFLSQNPDQTVSQRHSKLPEPEDLVDLDELQHAFAVAIFKDAYRLINAEQRTVNGVMLEALRKPVSTKHSIDVLRLLKRVSAKLSPPEREHFSRAFLDEFDANVVASIDSQELLVHLLTIRLMFQLVLNAQDVNLEKLISSGSLLAIVKFTSDCLAGDINESEITRFIERQLSPHLNDMTPGVAEEIKENIKRGIISMKDEVKADPRVAEVLKLAGTSMDTVTTQMRPFLMQVAREVVADDGTTTRRSPDGM
jgi:hypothetical protein